MVYGDVTEIIPKDVPKPLGKYLMLSHYVNANLCHNMLTGWSVTGILHFLNQMPVDCYSKKQATIKTATYGSELETTTYGSELISTCLAVDQIVDLHLTIWYLCVPIQAKSYLFGNNKSVVDSSSRPQAKLHKQHNALSFHWVHEAVATRFVSFTFMDGEFNPADILSKHWGYQQVWLVLKVLLFYSGNTSDLYKDD